MRQTKSTPPSLARRAYQAVMRMARKSQTLRHVVTFSIGGPHWSKSDIQLFAREGYQSNPYMYSACDHLVRGLAEPPPILYRVRKGSKIERSFKSEYTVYASLAGRSAKRHSLSGAARQAISERTGKMMRISGGNASICRSIATKQLAYEGELEEIKSHPILDLLSRPNGWYQTNFQEYVTAWGLSMLISGEVFTEPIGDAGEFGEPSELYILPAHQMRAGFPERDNPIPRWHFGGRGNTTFQYSPDPIETELFFTKLYDPLNPLRGLSPVEAAVRSLDLNNAARAWNLSFLKNAGIPPALVTGELTPSQASDVKDHYNEEVAGEQNAGRIVTISGKDLKYHQLSMDAAKLQWGDVITMTAREVAIVFGVPGEIIGDTSNRTYSNYAEARLSMYQDRVLPLADLMYGSWNSTWVRRFGDDLLLDYDADQIVAIAADVAATYDRLQGAGFLSLNEKRVAAGYPDVGTAGDVIFVPINMIPLEVAVSMDDQARSEHVRLVERMIEADMNPGHISVPVHARSNGHAK